MVKTWSTSTHQVRLLPKTVKSTVSGTLGNMERHQDYHNGYIDQMNLKS